MLAGIVARCRMFVHDLADHNLIFCAGKHFARLDRLDELVGVGRGVQHAVPKLRLRDDWGRGGRVDGFGVCCDDDDHV